MIGPKDFDPVADFEKRWPQDYPALTPVMAANRRVASAAARKQKALIDLDAAMRELFEAEAERDFIKIMQPRRSGRYAQH